MQYQTKFKPFDFLFAKKNNNIFDEKRYKKANKALKYVVDYQDFGAYTALIMGSASIYVSCITFSNWMYSIPCFIGGLIAVFSFACHEKHNQKVRRLDSRTMSENEFARKTKQFKTWIYKALKFDFASVFTWIFLSTPAIINYTSGVHKLTFLGSFAIAIGYILFALIMVKFILNDYENKFEKIEELGFTEEYV